MEQLPYEFIDFQRKIQFTKLHNEFHELQKRFVKLKLLCEFVEYAIIITRRAAEKAIAKIAFSAFLSAKIIILSKE